MLSLKAASNCVLKIDQDATGGWEVSFVGTPWLAGKEAYVASTDPNSRDLLTVYFDGTTYHIAPTYQFGPVV